MRPHLILSIFRPLAVLNPNLSFCLLLTPVCVCVCYISAQATLKLYGVYTACIHRYETGATDTCV